MTLKRDPSGQLHIDSPLVGEMTLGADARQNGAIGMFERYQIDLDACHHRCQTGPCFICEILARNPDYPAHIVYEDKVVIAFLDKYPPLYGYLLVAPRAHKEQVTGDFTLEEYLELQRRVYRITEAVRQELGAERIYLLSLGSNQGTAHVHWHVSPLPPGVPYRKQQLAAIRQDPLRFLKKKRYRLPRGFARGLSNRFNQFGEGKVLIGMTDRAGGDRQWIIGVAGALVHEGRVLLVRHTYGEKGGRWALPGGFTTQEERLDESVVRELLEETGIAARVVDVIGLVTRYSDQGGAVFVVFRMRPLSGDAVPDGVEVDRVGWFSAAQVAAMTDEELWSDIRNPALAALRDREGLLDDEHYPSKGERARGFLVKWV